MAESYGKRPLWQWVLIYLLVGGFLYWAAYYFYFSKQGGYGGTTPMYNTNAPLVGSMTVALAQENESGESGTATLTEVDGKVTVSITLTGFVDGVSQPAHIHVGACPGVGAVKYPLSNVLNGGSDSYLDVSLNQLKSELPLAINVHKSAEEAKVYTACGPLTP